MEKISRMSEIAGTLGSESRLVLVELIAQGEKSVDSLSELSGIPVASTSQHLQILKKSGVVVARRDGKRILYRLQNGPIRELVDALERLAVFRTLEGVGYLETDSIAPGQLEKKLKAGGWTLIDVRSREEFHKEHIAGAVGLPFEELRKPGARIPAAGCIVYCRGPYCLLSVHAAAVLKARGVPVLRLTSGLSAWPGPRVRSNRSKTTA